MKVNSSAVVGMIAAASAALYLGCTNSAGSTSKGQVSALSAAEHLSPLLSSSVPTRQGPVRLIRSDYKPGEVARLCDETIQRAQTRLDAVAALPAEQRTTDNVLIEFENAMADLSDDVQPLTFMGYVSTDEKISGEGSKCEEKLGQFSVGISSRRDLYQAISSVKARDVNETRLLEKTVEGFELNGLKLPDDKLAEVKRLRQELSQKESEYTANYNNDRSSVNFTLEELMGVPADFLSRLTKNADGTYVVTTKGTDYTIVMENASNAETRKRMLFAYQNRAATTNVKLLQEAVALRAQIAKLMGYETWADLRTLDRMAKTRKAVVDFLESLKQKLAARNQADFARLLKFKQELEPSATVLNQWDNAYYSYQLKKRDFNLDDEKIREYFPADVVISGMFDVYSRLLGVNFVEVKDAKVWAEGVKLYEIRQGTQVIAYFYADFIPRAGKYGHAAAFPLIAGRTLPDGAYSVPIASIVANFTPPAAGKPSLLTHDEVETTFHEFGHIMHQTLTRAPYASLSGSGTARDFVEAPSQMLENWVWSPEILSMISGHYLDHSKKLPQDILEKMLAARDLGQGMYFTRQLLLGLYDITLHSQADADPVKLYNDLYREILGQEPIAGGQFPASFGHLMGGYDAGYYGYLWSKVYAEDMFSTFEEKGLLNPELGARYRVSILEKGNMKDAIDLLREFLGREPNSEAFFKKLGIQQLH